MRAVLTETTTTKVRVGSHFPTRSERLRKLHLRSFSLEGLEQRTLMATIPAALVAGQVNISNSGGNQSSPSIAVNPLNPLQLAAVWTRLDANLAPSPTVVVEGAYSNNGGVSWTSFTPSAQVADFTSTATPPPLFAQATDASVDFDRNNNFYVVDSQHTADNTGGVLFLNKFNDSGGAPARIVELVEEENAGGVVRGMLRIDDVKIVVAVEIHRSVGRLREQRRRGRRRGEIGDLTGG